MANYGVNLGELAQALRMTGGDPSILQLDEEEDRAALPDNPYGTADDRPQGIQSMPFDQRAPTRQLRNEFNAGQNQGLNLAGEKGQIESYAADRMAAEAGTLSSRNEAGYQRAMQASGQLEADEARYRQMADEQLSQVIQAVGQPPPEKRGEVLQIVGAMLAAGGNGRGRALGTGLSLLGQSMNKAVVDWGQKLAMNKEALGAVLSTAAGSRDAAQSRATLEKSLQDIAYGTYGAAIEQIKQEATSEEQLRAAEELMLGMRQGYAADELKRRQLLGRGAGAAKLQRQRDMLINMDIGELEQLVKSGHGGELASKILLERKLNDQKVRLGEASIAEKARKNRGEGGPQVGSGVAGGYEIANPQVWGSLGEGTKSNFAKGVAAVPGLINDLTELKTLVEQHGTETLPGPIKSRMQALSAAALGGIKEAASLGALDNGVATLVAKQIGDPTAWNFGLGNWIENADTRIDETISSIQQNAQAKAAAYGLRPARPGGGGGGSPGANMVRVRLPDGRKARIPRGNLAKAVELGAVVDSPLAGR